MPYFHSRTLYSWKHSIPGIPGLCTLNNKTTFVESQDSANLNYNKTPLASTLHNFWDLFLNPTNETESQHTILANCIPPPKPALTEDVVMVTHTLVGSRLNNLLIQIWWWNGPVPVAIYILKPSNRLLHFWNLFQSFWLQKTHKFT